MIDQIVKNGNRFKKTRWLRKLRISDIVDIINMLQIEVPMFSQILVTIGQIIKKWQKFFKSQDGGSRHLEKYTSR